MKAKNLGSIFFSSKTEGRFETFSQALSIGTGKLNHFKITRDQIFPNRQGPQSFVYLGNNISWLFTRFESLAETVSGSPWTTYAVSVSATRSVWQRALLSTVLILLCLFPLSFSSDFFKMLPFIFFSWGMLVIFWWHKPLLPCRLESKTMPHSSIPLSQAGAVFTWTSLTKPQWAQGNTITTLKQVENTIKQITFMIFLSSQLLFLSPRLMKKYAKECQKTNLKQQWVKKNLIEVTVQVKNWRCWLGKTKGK